MKQLHEMIAEYRKPKGITQTCISEVTGIDNKRISNIETGRVELKAEEFILICQKGLGVSPSFFTSRFLETKKDYSA